MKNMPPSDVGLRGVNFRLFCVRACVRARPLRYERVGVLARVRLCLCAFVLGYVRVCTRVCVIVRVCARVRFVACIRVRLIVCVRVRAWRFLCACALACVRVCTRACLLACLRAERAKTLSADWRKAKIPEASSDCVFPWQRNAATKCRRDYDDDS